MDLRECLLTSRSWKNSANAKSHKLPPYFFPHKLLFCLPQLEAAPDRRQYCILEVFHKFFITCRNGVGCRFLCPVRGKEQPRGWKMEDYLQRYGMWRLCGGSLYASAQSLGTPSIWAFFKRNSLILVKKQNLSFYFLPN